MACHSSLVYHIPHPFASLRRRGERDNPCADDGKNLTGRRSPTKAVRSLLGRHDNKIFAILRGMRYSVGMKSKVSKDELAAFLEREVQEGDCLLFKGSNSMGVSVLAERFKKLAGLSEG